MITTHNQFALIPPAPVQLTHVTGKAQTIRTAPDTEMTLNHVLSAEVVAKAPIVFTLLSVVHGPILKIQYSLESLGH